MPLGPGHADEAPPTASPLSPPSTADDPALDAGPRVLASKLVPPLQDQRLVQRGALVERLTRMPPPRLTLVHAPAGFGKTTLLLQCHAALRRQRCDVVWLTLDAADNDVDRLVGHLDAGLARAGGRGAPGKEAAGKPRGAVLQDLHRDGRQAPRARPLLLFLDEFELLTGATALQQVQRLVEGLAPDCHLVLGSRSVPALELGRMRARGELLELGAEDLRFSIDETRSLLRDKHALELTDDELAALQQRTEGWPAAIHLAALSLANHRDRAGFIASFTGSHAALAEYLAEDILARLAPAVQSFLLEASVLPQFNAALCDAVRLQSDSRAILDELERAALFILPLDEERQWYRFHSLFGGFLRYRLERAQPGRLAALHRRAAAWFLAVRRPVPAIDHLIAGRAFDDAAALVAREADDLLAQGRVRLLARWLVRMPDEPLARFPRLRLVEAWTLVLNRRYPEAMRAVAAILAQAPTGPERDEAQTIRCLALSMSDRLDESLALADELIARLPPDEAFQYGVLANILAAGMIARHRYDDARRLLSAALQRHALARASFSRAVADYLEAAIDVVQGRLGQALRRLRPLALGAIGGERGRVRQAGHGRATVSVLLAVALYDTGAIDEARTLLAESLPYTKENGTPDALVLSHTLSARIAAVGGEREAALRPLADLEDIGRDAAMPRVIAAAWLERAWLHWNAGERDAARQALERAELGYASAPADNASIFMTDIDRPELMRARWMIDAGQAAAVLPVLEALLRDARAQQRGRRALRIGLLAALARQAVGDTRGALQAFGELLREAAAEAPVRAFLDEGPALAALFDAWQKSAGAGSDGVLPRFVGQLREAFDAQRGPGGAAAARIDALTRRELGVLQLLADGLRNADIAQRLFVSETTVKAHLRNINTKLGASSRTSAVAIARQHRLLG